MFERRQDEGSETSRPEKEKGDVEEDRADQERATALSHLDIRRTAEDGFADGSQELPHRGAIERSFGRDMSNVKAHVGKAAGAAASALGAEAYAAGDHVAFASAPDLHTAAHEAAHVVQQGPAETGGAVQAFGGGAMTTPSDALEQHADAVAERVVRGESAAGLLAAAPPGRAAIARKPEKVKPPADANAALAELKAQFAAGITKPERIPVLVVMLSDEHRVLVRDTRMSVIEQKCTMAQYLSVAEAVGATGTSVVEAAIRRGASPAIMRRAVQMLKGAEWLAIATNAGKLNTLRAALPGPLTQYFTTVSLFEIFETGPLMRWLVESMTPVTLWNALKMWTDKEPIVATLTREQLWGWLYKLQGSMMDAADVQTLRGFAEHASEPEKTKLEALASSGVQPRPSLPETATEADWKVEGKARLVEQHGAAKQLKGLVDGTDALKADKLLELGAKAGWEARDIASDARARTRIIKALDIDQLQIFVSRTLRGADQLDWVLDAAGADAQHLIPLVQGLGDDDAVRVFASSTRIARLKKVLGTMPFAGVVRRSEKLQKLALTNADARALLLGDATPRDLFEFVTTGDTGDSVARACRAIEKDFGYGWVYALSRSDVDTTKIRQLALALPDRDAAKHLLNFGIQDFPLQHNKAIGSEAMPPEVFESPGDEMRSVAVSDPSRVAAAATEMSDEERTKARADHALVGKAINASAHTNNMGFDAVRTARELDGSLPEMVRAIGKDHAPIDKSGFRTYARERPPAEHVQVAADPSLTVIARKLLAYSPFNTLPGVSPSPSLATVIGANPHFLDWIRETVDPAEAIGRLGATPELATKTARALESVGVDLIKALPLAGLTPNQKMALARIGAEATSGKLHDAVADRLVDDPDDPRNKQSSRTKQLGDVLDELEAKKANAKVLQAACNAHAPAEAEAVLVDTAHPHRIEFLRATLGVSPLTVFPALAPRQAELFKNTHVLRWLLGTEEPVAVLRTIGKLPAAIQRIALEIDIGQADTQHWLINLPSGYGLTTSEEGTLYQLFKLASTDDGQKSLFNARFGHLPHGTWTTEELDKMWTTLSRLPDRHVEGNLDFGGLTKMKEDGGELRGGYTPGTGMIEIKGKGGDESRYSKAAWQSKAQLAKQLGVDEGEVDRRVGAGLVEKEEQKGVMMFRIKPVPDKDLTYTLLHETGHAVDALLGNRTEFAFGMSGWRGWGNGEFDAWANDMNAWDGADVTAEDKAEIRVLFEQRLASSDSISGPISPFADLVPSEHALKKARNANAFIVKMVKSHPRAFVYTDPIAHDGRVFTMNFHYGRFFSYDAKIKDVLPLPYAGFAPEEWFAECYVEYYRDEANKGGNLPAWVKEWFDQNVDRIGHGPAKKP